MQNRMKTHSLTEEQMNSLLLKAHTGSLATINADGTPYSTPVHFVYFDNRIYIHGLPKGQKIDNIIRNGKVGFSVFDMQGFLPHADGKPCGTNTIFESAIVTGNAVLLEDTEAKRIILQKIVEKYTPNLANALIPENMVKATAVIQIEIVELTGKYYK